MAKRHKWAEVIIAYAEGKKIQIKNNFLNEWRDWEGDVCPDFDPNVEYQIKPTESVVRWLWICQNKSNGLWFKSLAFLTDAEANEYFDPAEITTRFKDEASRVEFPKETLINGLTVEETDQSASCLGLSNHKKSDTIQKLIESLERIAELSNRASCKGEEADLYDARIIALAAIKSAKG